MRSLGIAVSAKHHNATTPVQVCSACALALRTPSAAPHAVQPRCLHGLATRERASESIPSTSSSAAPRSASCGSRKSCSAATTSAPSFSITAGSCTALASLVSQERHQLDQHQERAASGGAIRALKAPPPSFIMRSIPWWVHKLDIVTPAHTNATSWSRRAWSYRPRSCGLACGPSEARSGRSRKRCRCDDAPSAP